MNERHLSLTDVMLGIERLSLQNVLTPANFRFFWGLIMIGNRLDPRFKNPFDVTVNQAIGAGGGESRQAVNRRQHALKKTRIDGQWLIKIKAGSKVNNRPALYEINYNLIVPSHIAAPVFERQPSQKKDGLDDGYDDGVQDGLDDGNRTILRSDQRRREETTPQSPPNEVTTQVSSETENGGGGDLDSQGEEKDPERDKLFSQYHSLTHMLFDTKPQQTEWEYSHLQKQHYEWTNADVGNMIDLAKAAKESKAEDKPKMITMAKNLQALILRKWKGQISKGPDIGKCKEAIREHGYPLLMGAVSKSPDTLDHQNPRSALNCVITVAKGMQEKGNGGVSKEFLEKREGQLEDMRTALANALEYPEKNAAFIEQQTERIGLATASLQRLREG